MPAVKKGNRKEQILQCLAEMLESHSGQRITTAKLAERVGVSEAALYRHFPSKARMYEGLMSLSRALCCPASMSSWTKTRRPRAGSSIS